jgi:hypothetical protein
MSHSQGGLVCRVAVAALCDYEQLDTELRMRRGMDPSYFNHAALALQGLDQKALERTKPLIHSVVMLATPNAGAFTNGQFALQATMAMKAARKAATIRWKNFEELSTDKLFTVLQNVRVKNVKYLSVSGSAFNRYQTVSWAHLAEVDMLARLAPSLDLPNDWIVEDKSVGLNQAPLPPEIDNLAQQYVHIRSYSECIRISHTQIHSDPNVWRVLEREKSWQ